MTSEFNPPIKERQTRELLEIVGSEEKWNPTVVELAYIELKERKVDPNKINHSKYLADKSDKIDALKKGRIGYDIFEIISEPLWPVVEILFSWELKKDGYLRKARQQKRVRIVLLILIIAGFIYSKM